MATDKAAGLALDFTRNGNAGAYLGEGWSSPEMQGTWTLGHSASLLLPAVDSAAATRLHLLLWALVRPPRVPRQRLRVEVNGAEVGTAEVRDTGDTRLSFAIPAGLLLTDAPNRLVLHHPDAARPSDISEGSRDGRLLGIHLRTLLLSPEAAPGAVGPARRLVLVRGDLQAADLARVFRNLPWLEEDWEFRHIPERVPVAAALQDTNGRTVIVWAQAAPGWADPHSEPAELPAGTRVLRFPRIEARCLWPLRGTDPRIRPEPPDYPAGRWPHSDRIAAEIAAERLGEAEGVAEYLRRSEAQLPDAVADYAADRARWRAADQGCDVQAAPFLEQEFRRSRLFHAPSDLAGPTLRFLAESLLALSLTGTAEMPSEVLARLARFLTGYEGQFLWQIPVHPAVAARLGLGWRRPGQRFRWCNNQWTFEEYVAGCIAWAPWTP